jgi:hypothetical protein
MVLDTVLINHCLAADDEFCCERDPVGGAIPSITQQQASPGNRTATRKGINL